MKKHSMVCVKTTHMCVFAKAFFLEKPCIKNRAFRMYEKNCLNYGFIARVPHTPYALVLQMHPSSQQEKEDFFAKVRAIDTHASMHTIHAHTLHTQNDPTTRMLLTAVKGASCVITCDTYDAFVSLLQMCDQKTEKTVIPFTVVGAKYHESMLDPASITVLAQKSLQWDTVLEMTQAPCFMVGSLHIHVEKCTCDPVCTQDTLSM